MKPVIAMPQMGNDLFRQYMKSKYVHSLNRAGAEVYWIELEDPVQAVKDALKCDGLLLPGGADINPELYGQVPSEACGNPNTLRDTGEWSILEAFLSSQKPILCICRGFQLLNVFFGGTLYQDIKALQRCSHMHMLSAPKGIHNVSIVPNTMLSEVVAHKETVFVNSLHHQAVDRVGQGLTVSANSEDGFVEALEMTDYPFCLGVQWHPEHMSKKSLLQQGLFNQFVSECKVK